MDRQVGPRTESYNPVNVQGKSDKRRLLVWILVVVLVIAPVVTAAAALIMYSALLSSSPTFPPPPNNGGFVGVIVGSTLVNVTFDEIGAKGYELKVVIENSTSSGTYVFLNNSTGQILVIENGINLATIEYVDLVNNGEVNHGDKLVISGLSPSTPYSVRVQWAESHEPIDALDFTTLP